MKLVNYCLTDLLCSEQLLLSREEVRGQGQKVVTHV